MSNFLESIPCDILQYIALLATLGSQPVLTTPRPVSMLLLTSSTLHRSLCVKSCPHLYANIFRATFDTRAGRRRFTFQLTDSALACELLFRHKMLRNVRHRSFLPAELRQDLWTAFWMVQESDGLNELHLRLAGLVEYLFDIVKRWTGDTISISRESGPTRELQSLVIWLLCFTLSRECILSLSPDVKGTLQSLLLPHTWNDHRPSAISTSFLLSHHDQDSRPNYIFPSADGSVTYQQYQYPPAVNSIVIYARNWVSRYPDPAPGATNLLLCIGEIGPMEVLPHLPATRAIANATQRVGPTKEDVHKIRGYLTKLFADTISWTHRPDYFMNDVRRSEKHDLEFQRMIFADQCATEVTALPAMHGMLTGIWEGYYMMEASGTIGGPHHDFPFLGRQPLQAVFTEFVCLDSNKSDLPSLDVISGKRNLLKLNSQTEGAFEFESHKYERLTPDSDSKGGCNSQQGAREPMDILLLGETLEDHAQAWGGFDYAGRIRKDGSIILKRESQREAGSGVWIFEGRVRFGTVLVGTWYPNAASVQGIYSMQKRAKDATSW